MKPISLARGWPSADLLPVAELRAAALAALDRHGAEALNYGAAEGYAPLREWFAARHGVTADRIVLTNGSLQGVALVLEHVFRTGGGRVVVEAPTYDRTVLALRRFGATEIEAVPVEADGLDVETLGRACAAGRVPRLVYVIPNFQNPTGVTLARAKRERLVALAAAYDFLVLEDDPYRDVRVEGTDEPTMLSRDRADRVLDATSLTKTIAPGVRVGALILPPPVWAGVRQLANDTYIAPSYFSQATVAEYCAAGCYEPGLARIRPALRARRDAMMAAVDRHFGERARYVRPAGGYFLWLRLPGVDTDALAGRAEAAGVPVVKGTSCYTDGSGRDALRLAFSAAQPDDIAIAVARLATLL